MKVVDNLSFSVNPGETVALVGAGGCGKSTIMALLEQFYHPDAGEILLDGVPVSHIEPSHFRANIGSVAQEPQLFSMMIRENIVRALCPMILALFPPITLSPRYPCAGRCALLEHRLC